MADSEKALRRARAAFSVKDNWIGMLRDAFEFALPQRNTYEVRQKGANKMDRVFDSTAIRSTNKFASQLQSKLVPPFQNWATLTAGPVIPEAQKKEITTILQNTEKKLFAAIHASNFDMSIAEFFLDLATGTAAMMILEGGDDNPLNFLAVPNEQIAIDEGPMGSVDGVFRRHKMKIRNIELTWDDAKIPEAVKQRTTEDSEAEVDITEATFFNKAANNYDYQVIITSEDGKKTESDGAIVERSFPEHPWVITRWIKAPGETWGRGPLLVALPDIKTLNKVKELVLKNASLAIAGVWSAPDDGVLNPSTIKIVPGAIIPHAQGSDGLKPLETGGRFDVAQLIIQDLQDNIRGILLDTSLPPETGAVRSATEIIARIREFQETTGAPFGRIMSELIRPLLQRSLGILNRKGILEFPVKIDGLAVKVTATSPLARLQAVDDLESVVQWIGINAGLGDEVVKLGIKVEDLPAWTGDKLGIDEALIRTKDDRSRLQQIAGAAAAQGAQIPVGGGAQPIAA